MKDRRNITYRIQNNNIEYLRELHFVHAGDGVFVHDFPVYKWQGFVTITGRFTAYDTKKEINVDVYQEDGRPYAPYYMNENSDVVSVIRSNISKECRKLNIKEGVKSDIGDQL